MTGARRGLGCLVEGTTHAVARCLCHDEHLKDTPRVREEIANQTLFIQAHWPRLALQRACRPPTKDGPRDGALPEAVRGGGGAQEQEAPGKGGQGAGGEAVVRELRTVYQRHSGT